jgi:hypothetical protein
LFDITFLTILRDQLLQEFTDQPPSFYPQNDKYLPALCPAIKELSLLSLNDIGLPETGITMEDIEKGTKRFQYYL